MKINHTYLLTLLAITAVVGCRTSSFKNNTTVEKTDSSTLIVAKQTTVKDSVVVAPPSSTKIVFALNVDSNKQVAPFTVLFNKHNGSTSIAVRNNNIEISDSSNLLISRLTTQNNTLDSVNKSLLALSQTNDTYEIETIYQTPKWAIWLMLSEGLVILVLLLLVTIILK